MTQPDPAAHAEAILKAAFPNLTPLFHNVWKGEREAILFAVRALRAEAFEAGVQAGIESATQEASAWFPAGTATHYPAGGVVSAIRAINPADLRKDNL